MSTAQNEQSKYTTVWQHEEYRQFSPGLRACDLFHLPEVIAKLGARRVLDAGCGSGKLMRKLIEALGVDVTVHGFDIAENCLDPWFSEIRDEVLHVGCLWEPADLPGVYDVVLCTDVLEHIPTERIPAVLANLRAATGQLCYLAVALFADGFGERILGQPLHLTVKPPEWWLEQLSAAGFTCFDHAVEKDLADDPVWLHAFCEPTPTE